VEHHATRKTSGRSRIRRRMRKTPWSEHDQYWLCRSENLHLTWDHSLVKRLPIPPSCIHLTQLSPEETSPVRPPSDSA
jgi:hypothetical protein